MRKYFILGTGFLLLFLFSSCITTSGAVAGVTNNTRENTRAETAKTDTTRINNTVVSPLQMPENYIPKYALEKAEETKKDFLQKNAVSASDLSYKFFYNNEGNACLEFTVIPRSNYVWNPATWIGYTWTNYFGSIDNNRIRYTLTKKAADEAQYRMDQRRNDSTFNEIEKVVLKVALENQYDFFGAYGITVKYRNPNIKKAKCDGFSNAVSEAFKNHPLVDKVERWGSRTGNHEWNVIVLNDGRKIYCDATWYQGNRIDNEGFVVEIPDQNPVNLTFDINEFNSLGGAVNSATGRLLAVHFAWSDARLQ